MRVAQLLLNSGAHRIENRQHERAIEVGRAIGELERSSRRNARNAWNRVGHEGSGDGETSIATRADNGALNQTLVNIETVVKDACSAANDRLVVMERIPSEAYARGDVVLIGGQGRLARIHFVSHSIIERQVGERLPGVLSEYGIQRIGGADYGVSEALLVSLGEA